MVGRIPVTNTDPSVFPGDAVTVGAFDAAATSAPADEQTRYVSSESLNSADQQVYVNPPERSVDPSESFATC